MLLQVLQHERFKGDEESGESWEEGLADAFVIDSAGHFAKVGSGTLRTHERCLGPFRVTQHEGFQ